MQASTEVAQRQSAEQDKPLDSDEPYTILDQAQLATLGAIDRMNPAPSSDIEPVADLLPEDEEMKLDAVPLAAIPVKVNATEILPSPVQLQPYPGIAVAGNHTHSEPIKSSTSHSSAPSTKRRGRAAVRGATRTQRVRAARPTAPMLAKGPPISSVTPKSAEAQSDLYKLGVPSDMEDMDWESVDEMPFPNGVLLPKRKSDPKSDPRAARADADDSWFCQVCFAERMPASADPKGGLFAPLLQTLQQTNPKIFALPADLRNYYKGVSTSEDGTYVDSTSLRPLKLSRQGFVEERDAFQLRDKQGQAVLCYQCGGSSLPLSDVLPNESSRAPTQAEELVALESLADLALKENRALRAPSNGRRMLSCDFCNLHWHLDCLDPPMQTMPSTTRRWKCPAHSAHAEPRIRIPRAANQTKTVQVELLTDSATPNPSPPRPYGEVEVIPDRNDRYFHPDSGKGRSTEPPYEDLTISRTDGTRLHYRIPEKTIRLEFWQRARNDRSRAEFRQKAAATRTADTPSARGAIAKENLDRDSLQTKNVSIPSTALDRLIAVALGESRVDSPSTQPEQCNYDQLSEHRAAADASLAANSTPFEAAMRSTYQQEQASELVPSAIPGRVLDEPEMEPFAYLYRTELAQLRAIKQMLLAKGPDRLREFLQES
ncbi:hypothetical protein MYAM1_003901 [Malassezia yamatoensis]|uniref:Zinc finger PHD-type domain-containing protein n=1 Tax=Malassezia yamatoensis TaxID=253288 RepID=A0AAJ5Z2G0_9BASI|nr:hypothetical protein MYAM1_003901 [Malassezia yamatoensis]